MRKLSALVLAVVLLAAPAALAGEQPDGKSVAMTGWITDATCGAANANAEGKACAAACARNGAQLVLFSA